MNSTDMAPSDGLFVTASVNNHPNFTPSKTPAKTPKPPKGPEKPLMPYMRYSREIWESVKAANPEQKLSEIGRIIGRMWREMAPHEKQKYIDDYDVEKVKYADAFKIYQNSPAYQQYLAAKDKFHADEKEVKGKVVPKSEPRITLPACDNDDAVADDLDYFHLRQMAAARFHRNQSLLLEVFNEACVPDLRQVITAPRLLSLKRQVETLTMHQRKIDTEVNQLVESFETKKRRLEDGSREFQLTLEKCTKPAVTSTAYDNMVEQAERQLLEKYRAYVKNVQQQQQNAASTTPPLASVINSSALDTSIDQHQRSTSSPPIKSTPPIENGNGKADFVVKSEPVELQNGESTTNRGSKTINDVNDSKINSDGGNNNRNENGTASRESVNGFDNGCKNE